jgi:hypothetical protein
MKQDSYTKEYDAKDGDDYNYIRIDSISNINEINKVSLLSFPVLLEKKVNVGRKLFLNLGLGGVLFYTNSTTYSIEADASYGGLYNFSGSGYDFNVYINDPSIYDFGRYDMSGNGNMSFKQLNFGVIAKLGIGYKVTRQSSIELNVTYDRSFGEVFDESGSDLSSNKDYINSLSYVFPHYIISELFTNIGFNIKF